MRRRTAISLVLGAFAPSTKAATRGLERFVGSPAGTAIVIDVKSRRLLGIANAPVAARFVAPPGSTWKPFVLSALIERGRLGNDNSFLCPGRLRIANRTLDCSHPPLTGPIHIDSAIAYSCNCFVAQVAERFEPGELKRVLEGYGFASRSGLIEGEEACGNVLDARSTEMQRLQALGEDGSVITAAELALAYRAIALKVGVSGMRPILDGLEGAVEYGTAQNARVAGVKIAGKTGSAIDASGQPVAWFAGFLPSRSPEIVAVVMLPGRSGGADAAPIAGRIFEAYHAGHL